VQQKSAVPLCLVFPDSFPQNPSKPRGSIRIEETEITETLTAQVLADDAPGHLHLSCLGMSRYSHASIATDGIRSPNC
jgi:hypothetical protein